MHAVIFAYSGAGSSVDSGLQKDVSKKGIDIFSQVSLLASSCCICICLNMPMPTARPARLSSIVYVDADPVPRENRWGDLG